MGPVGESPQLCLPHPIWGIQKDQVGVGGRASVEASAPSLAVEQYFTVYKTFADFILTANPVKEAGQILLPVCCR